MTQLRKSYLVCATPRSGSTLLCEMLLATGRAGRPLEHFEYLRHSSLPRQPREYFDGVRDSEILDHLAPVDSGTPSREPAGDWWARIAREGSTDNGVWGGKIMWGHVDDFLSRTRELPGLADARLDEVFGALFGEPTFVFVSRPDKVAQAISLWRAVQTQSWRHDDEAPTGPPIYSFAAIDHLVAQLAAHERAWSDWFQSTGHTPLPISYDEMDDAPQATVERVLATLGLDGVDVPDPHLSKQRDEYSLAWAERYRRERYGRERVEAA